MAVDAALQIVTVATGGSVGRERAPRMIAALLADLGLRRVTFHRAYVVFAPTIQFLLLAAAALGYRPP